MKYKKIVNCKNLYSNITNLNKIHKLNVLLSKIAILNKTLIIFGKQSNATNI